LLEEPRCHAEECAGMMVRLAKHAAPRREADDIRALVTRVRDAPGVTMDGQALTAWCSWALARADLLDPVLSGALASGFKLATAKAGIAPGST
jgi:hypothetical protein